MNFNPPTLADLNLNVAEGREIKRTRSICPMCLEPLDARVYERSGEVWMDKCCPEHGEFSALLSSDVRHYYRPIEGDSDGGTCCGSSCGLPAGDAVNQSASNPWGDHSCTVLIEIIERCNLSCPTCFAGSSPQHSGVMSLEEFTAKVDRLAGGGKTGADMIQLSGGEPTIHPQLFDMLEVLFKRGFMKVCINSNGIKLAQRNWIEKLARITDAYSGAEIFIYLQFDGFDAATHLTLRGRGDLLSVKRRALAHCRELGIRAHPVMTLTRDVNDHEVGDFVRLAVDNPQLKNVVIQPAMYSGRYDNPRRQDRITLADTVKLVCDQFGVFEPRDFMPIPCSDPNCFGMAVALRTRKGLLPLSRHFPRHETWQDEQARDLIDRLSDSINGPQAFAEALRWAGANNGLGAVLDDLEDAEIEELLDVLADTQAGGTALWDRLLTISIKPFMDAWTYDQDRIDQCCVHILDPQGNPVSLCEYNAIQRPRQNAGGALDLLVQST